MKKTIAALGMLLLTGVAHAAVKGEEVTYQSGDTQLKGYLAYDDEIKGERPAVLVVHEWWGHNDYARQRARMLAELGYVALAVDMYGDGKQADHPDNAMKFMQEAIKSAEVATNRFKAAIDVLKASDVSDDAKMAAIGYCFGGGIVLNMARAGLDLDAVVSFHGSLDPVADKAQPGQVKAKIAVFNGAEDPFVPQASIDAFKQEMDQAGVDYRFVNLPSTMHSFTNPEADSFAKRFNMPLAYNAQADARSWREMQALFDEVFK